MSADPSNGAAMVGSIQDAAREIAEERLRWAAGLAFELALPPGPQRTPVTDAEVRLIEIALDELANAEARLGDAVAMVKDPQWSP